MAILSRSMVTAGLLTLTNMVSGGKVSKLIRFLCALLRAHLIFVFLMAITGHHHLLQY